MPYPVEKKLNRWQSIKMELGGWAFGIIILFILIIIGRIIFKSKIISIFVYGRGCLLYHLSVENCYFSRTGDNALFIPLRMRGCVKCWHNLFLFICNKKTPQRLKLRGLCQIRILTEFKRCLMNHFAYVLQGI